MSYHVNSFINSFLSMKATNVKLRAFNGSSIPVKGQCILNVNYLDRSYPLLFYVVDVDSVPILGLRASEKLGLIKRVHSINPNASIFDQYDDCFDEIRTLPKTHRIIID